MTQDEMDKDVRNAATLLQQTRLTVDRSRHESTTETALWFMDGDSQVGSATRIDGGWRVNRMFNGSPSSERLEAYLGGAVAHIVSADPHRFDPRFRVIKTRGRVR